MMNANTGRAKVTAKKLKVFLT